MPIQETSMVRTNIHYAHQSIFNSTYKHSYSHQSISHGTYKHLFSFPNILHCTRETFILHTIAYCIANTKHSYYTPVYKTRLRLKVCHSCVWFLLCVLSISLRRVVHTLWVPQTASDTATNGICRNELCTARCALGVRVGAQHHDAEYTT